MKCSHFDAGRCRSCTLLATPYATQVARKQEHVRELLGGVSGRDAGPEWLPPVTGPEAGFRNKAKMAVSGTVETPVLGIVDRAGHGVDLTDCGLYPPALEAAFRPLAAFVTRALLEPYRIEDARGELKYLLVTISPDDELMVRFVLRSTEALARIKKHLPWLLDTMANLSVVTVNIQPAHAAVLEGEREIVLTERSALSMRIDGVPLRLRPQSFFQTNTSVATSLYRHARAWVNDVDPSSLWDLYCGVGGFALHCAVPGRAVTGIELSAEAVAAASDTARELGLDGVRFEAGDARDVVDRLADDAPEMVIVNPPRRGIGPELARSLDRSTVGHLLYSSCNATTLSADLEHLPSFRPVRGVMLDMFPQTRHYEVLLQLRRR